MSSISDGFDVTVTMHFEMVAVTRAERAKANEPKYTNLRCDSCWEWWVMICLDKKKVFCPWCGEKLTVKNL